MSIDISKKRILMIHGLASKPPKNDLHEMWQKCVIENIAVDDTELAQTLSESEGVFQSTYWANETPHHLEDDADYVEKLWPQVNKVISERKEVQNNFHVGLGEKVGDFFKDRGIDLVKILAGALTVKDDVMKAFLRETQLYDEDQYIADKMRQPLESALREAWDANCDVTILSHSMGTFIAYDALWRFAHRNVEGFSEYKDKRVQLFVTMGSPLGEPAVRKLLFSKQHKADGTRHYPTNIDYWHNYSCLGDVVSHQPEFDDIFFEPMRSLGLFPENSTTHAIDYANLHNPFEVVSHYGNQDSEKRNPHKSFGYLVQPRLGTWVADFLKGELE